MVLLGASCLVLTQVSVDGSFLGGLFPGLQIFGLGEGYRSAFAAAAGFTVLDLIAALLLPGRPRAGRAGTRDAVSAPAPGATRPTHERGQGDRHEGSDR
jgi:hypothetical protein